MNYSDLKVGKYYLIKSLDAFAFYKYSKDKEFTFIKDMTNDTFDGSQGSWTEKWLIKNEYSYIQHIVREINEEEKIELL